MNRLIVTFSSRRNPGRPRPAKAFERSLRRICLPSDFREMYILSNCNDWFVSGAVGYDSQSHLLETLSGAVGQVDKAFFLGNSMGGYGALHFASLINSSHVRVLAFSPQVNMSQKFRSSIDDNRFFDQDLQALYSSNQSLPLNLLDVYPDKPLFRSSVFVGDLAGLDVAHALLLSGRVGVKINRVKGCNHDLCHQLRERGDLDVILKNYFLHEETEEKGS